MAVVGGRAAFNLLKTGGQIVPSAAGQPLPSLWLLRQLQFDRRRHTHTHTHELAPAFGRIGAAVDMSTISAISAGRVAFWGHRWAVLLS